MTDYSNIGAVCFECAKKAGFVLKKEAAGVWVGMCGICHEWRMCTDLWHDWKPSKESEHKRKGSEEINDTKTTN